MFDAMIKDLSALPQVEAIALGGSRAGTVFDEKSDYDIYLYCTAPVSEDARKKILSKYCSYVEYSNHYWELEDNGTFNDGVDFDLLFRNLDDFTADLASVVEHHQARNGYTTCMWHNLLTCKILYDENGRLKAAKDRFSVPYPQELKQNIISRNRALLRGCMPAYEDQINKAVGRNDLVSINHRVAAFMESYFDLLFALNEQTHPGEKRLMQLCTERCKILPNDFQDNLSKLFANLYVSPGCISADLDMILKELEKIL